MCAVLYDEFQCGDPAFADRFSDETGFVDVFYAESDGESELMNGSGGGATFGGPTFFPTFLVLLGEARVEGANMVREGLREVDKPGWDGAEDEESLRLFVSDGP